MSSKALKPITNIEADVLSLYAQGISRKAIAYQLDIPVKSVTTILSKPDNKAKLTELIEEREIYLKSKHLAILEDITDRMLEESEGDVLNTINKNRDILDVMDLTNKLTKETEKKRLGTNTGNNIINILNSLGGDDD